MKFAKILSLLLMLALFGGLMTACDEKSPEPVEPTDGDEIVATTDGEEEDPAEPTVSRTEMAFKEITGAQLMSEMGAGWNLGNTLDASGRDATSPMRQETAWGNPVTTPEMAQLLVDTGFKTLRVPVTWQVWIGEGPEFLIDEAWMNRVQEVVDYGIERDLYVILNLHHERWHYPSEENYEAGKAQLIAVWAQIAEHFGGYSEKLIFETMNEPRGRENEWTGGTDESRGVINKWNQACLDVIRASGGNNEKRWVMVPTHAASADEPALKGFVVPDDPNVIVSVHAYVYWRFALNPQSARNDFDLDNADHLRPIDELFERLDRHYISKGIPVVMGEMGCVNKDNPEDRIRWTQYYTSVAAAHGVPCVWWDNGIKEKSRADEESFGIMNRRDLDWWYPEIAQAMVDAFN
ncbi:MAG: glycoside hydrolase family 5 protein [Oscillospiraceae bacterium]|nr:glycoside hydrolase family 5 protein [Oscillospiraceae bacterium]